MKKLFAALIALCLALTACAFAESNVKGELTVLDALEVKFLLPEGFGTVALTDEDVDFGAVAYYQKPDESAYISVVYIYIEDMTVDDYVEELEMFGATDITPCMLNGMMAVTYRMPDFDNVVATVTTQSGHSFEVTCGPVSADGMEEIAAAVLASIQPK